MDNDYNMDLTVFLSHHAGILSKSGLEKITGVNQKQFWNYSSREREHKRQRNSKTDP
jgi:hypothetical protein